MVSMPYKPASFLCLPYLMTGTQKISQVYAPASPPPPFGSLFRFPLYHSFTPPASHHPAASGTIPFSSSPQFHESPSSSPVPASHRLFPGRNAPKPCSHTSAPSSPAPSRLSWQLVTYTRSTGAENCDNKRTYGSPVCSSASHPASVAVFPYSFA